VSFPRISVTSAPDARWLVLLPALAIVFLSSVDLTVIAPILPLILLDLNINAAEADRYVWIASGYLIAYTSCIPLFGRLSDTIGRYRALMLAAALFVGGSLICAMADSLWVLVLGRIIQGAGGGAMLPVTLALVADLYDERSRAPMLGIVGAVETVGWVLGPMWGSLIEQIAGSWRWIFWINVPAGVLIGTAMFRPAKEIARAAVARHRLDLISAALVVAGLATITTGLSIAETTGVEDGARALGAQDHPLDGYRLPIVVAGVSLLAAFVLRQTRVSNALVPLRLFRIKQFTSAAIANFGMGVALMVALVNVPVAVAVLVSASRLSIVTAQLLAGFSIPMALTALSGGFLVRQFGRMPPAVIGFALGAVGYFLMSRWPYEIDFAAMLPGLVLAGAGLGLVIAPLADAALHPAGEADRGIAASLVIVMRLLGMTLGISILSAWATGQVDSRLRAIDIPPQRDAETTAEYLARQEEYLFDQAIPITLDILQTTFLVAGIVCSVALLAALWVGRRRPDSPAQGSP
jgi:EmrB/QacA subfamily drug resistance transporter